MSSKNPPSPSEDGNCAVNSDSVPNSSETNVALKTSPKEVTDVNNGTAEKTQNSSSVSSVCTSPASSSTCSGSKSPGASDGSLFLPSPGFTDKSLTATKSPAASPTKQAAKPNQGRPGKTYPKKIPLSRVSVCSSSTEENGEESSADAEDPRTTKATYATLGELVFSKCAFVTKDKDGNEDSFKNRAEELREKVRQRKVDKDQKKSVPKKSEKPSSSKTINDDEELVKDLENHSKRDLSKKQQKQVMPPVPPKKKTNKQNSSASSKTKATSGKVEKKKSSKNVKLNKLDLLEEYAQMLRDAIKDEGDSDSDDESSSSSSSEEEQAPSKRKTKNRRSTSSVSKKERKVKSKRGESDDIQEVIKIEPQSDDEMDLGSPESIAINLPIETEFSVPITIKDENESDVVCVKEEPGTSVSEALRSCASGSFPSVAANYQPMPVPSASPCLVASVSSNVPMIQAVAQPALPAGPPPIAPLLPSDGTIPFPPPGFVSSSSNSTQHYNPPSSSGCQNNTSSSPLVPALQPGGLLGPAPPFPNTSLNSGTPTPDAAAAIPFLMRNPSPAPILPPPPLPTAQQQHNPPPPIMPAPIPSAPPQFRPQLTATNIPPVAPPPYTPFPSNNMPFRQQGPAAHLNVPGSQSIPNPMMPQPNSAAGLPNLSGSVIPQGNFGHLSQSLPFPGPAAPQFSAGLPTPGISNQSVEAGPHGENQIPNMKPVAQVNSTIVLDPNNPRAPLTFNTKLTSYVPESFAAAQITPTFSTANLSANPTTTIQSSANLNSSSVSNNLSHVSGHHSENRINRSDHFQTQSPRTTSYSQRDQPATSTNAISRKRQRSPPSSQRNEMEVSIDFTREITYETFLGKSLGTKPLQPKSSPTKKSSFDPVAFDYFGFKCEVNNHEWRIPLDMYRKREQDRSLVVSTNAFGYYLYWNADESLMYEGSTDKLKQLQKSFEVLMRTLSRENVPNESPNFYRDLHSVMMRLSSLMLKHCGDFNLGSHHSGSSDRRNNQNKKNADVMLKQLRINVAGSGTRPEDEMWKSNLESLLSVGKCEETLSDLPGESYHSKAARSRKKRMKGTPSGPVRRSLLISKIDNFIDESEIDDELISDKLKLDYVELRRKERSRLHHDIYPNEAGYFCDKPACTCVGDNKLVGPHHNVFHNDPKYKHCDPDSNNLSSLYHYYIKMTPEHHFFLTEGTKIHYDDHDYIFHGYSLFSHEPLENIPAANYTKGQTQYSLEIVEEPPPTSFSVRDCDLLSDFIFHNLLEFFDFSLLDERSDDNDEPLCRKFHFLPRFERELPESGIEVLSAHVILRHIISSFAPLFDQNKLNDIRLLDSSLRSRVASSLKDYLVYYPGKKPTCVRVDNIAFENNEKPRICHTSLLPSTLSFLGDKKFLNMKKLHAKIKETMHFRNDPSDQDWLKELERMMDEHKKTKRATLVCDLPVENCFFSGLKCDITHCAVFLPRVVFQIRRHLALQRLCKKFDYVIRNPLHFEVAFTHSTASENVMDGTNKSHVRASRYRVGKNMNDVPIFEKGMNRKVKAAKHKRNLFTMINTMKSLPTSEAEIVDYPTTENYERIEFLGDAVLEMIVTTHLFFMLPEAKEGILSLFRIPLVANTFLSKVSKKAGLHRHLVVSHDVYFNLPGPREKMHADILESFLGAIFLDSGITEADRIFSQMYFQNSGERDLWKNLKPHELQREFPNGDRHLIKNCETLRKLTELEELTGIKFKHISLLARALTSNALGHNFLSRTSNERMEFLGDTVMKLLVTNFIYRHFPVYHENHLSTLRGSLVSRYVQEEVTKELRLSEFTLDKLCADLNQHQSCNLVTTKRKADLFEAFLAAVFLDQGLETCHRIFKICLFPKIPKLIKNQKWLTPHLMLHCCFLAIRSVADLEKSLVLIPSYRILPMLESDPAAVEHNQRDSPNPANKHALGPTKGNTSQTGSKRVGVFIGGKMFGVGIGKSLNQAAVQACREALTFFQSKHPNTLASMLNERVQSIVGKADAGFSSDKLQAPSGILDVSDLNEDTSEVIDGGSNNVTLQSKNPQSTSCSKINFQCNSPSNHKTSGNAQKSPAFVPATSKEPNRHQNYIPRSNSIFKRANGFTRIAHSGPRHSYPRNFSNSFGGYCSYNGRGAATFTRRARVAYRPNFSRRGILSPPIEFNPRSWQKSSTFSPKTGPAVRQSSVNGASSGALVNNTISSSNSNNPNQLNANTSNPNESSSTPAKNFYQIFSAY